MKSQSKKVDYRQLKANDKDYYEISQPSKPKSLAEKFENFPVKIWQKILNKSSRLSDLTKLKLSAETELIKPMDYQRHRIKLRVNSGDEYKRINACKKEPWTVKWIENSLRPGEVLFDIGANVGVYSLVAAKATEGKAKIFAFEPAFFNFSSLCYNIELNHCQNCITPFQVALYSKTSLVNFKYSTLSPGSALHMLGKTDESFECVYEQPVLSYRLDDFIEEFNLPVPNHLKLDVDGTELDIIDGSSKMLSDARLKTLMIELNEDSDRSDEKLVDFLAEKGFILQERHLRINDKGMRNPYSFCIFSRGGE